MTSCEAPLPVSGRCSDAVVSTDTVLFLRLCGFEPFFDPRGDQYMYSRILNCDYEFVSPWWDDVSLNAKDLVGSCMS